MSLVDDLKDAALDAVNDAVSGLLPGEVFDDPFGFLSNVRSRSLPTNAIPTFKSITAATTVNKEGNDWRVRLTVPKSIQMGSVLKPLIDTGNSMVFPFTPSIIMMHSANYNSLQPVHSNYPFPVYESSRVDDIQITGDFFVENSVDAEYWLASIHFLRSVTKMFYGESTSNAGAPPPLSRLNGYGDYVFKDVPIIITSFQVELAQDIDYIKVQVPGVTGKESWAPSHSVITVSCRPTYSRDTVRQFSLDKFVKGDFIADANSTGFI
jgi:hypothetical protein